MMQWYDWLFVILLAPAGLWAVYLDAVSATEAAIEREEGTE